MSYRKFWMSNGQGKRIYFTRDCNIYLNNPTGLGYSNTVTTNQYANALSVIAQEQNFASVGGEILFISKPNRNKYEQYNDFVDFLSYEPLTLYYQIPNEFEDVYSMDVAVGSLDKTETKNDDIMRCTFSLMGLSRWKGEQVVIEGTANTYSILNPSHMPVGFEITIKGRSFVNPYFTLTQDGEVYGEAKFNSVAPASYSNTFTSVYVNSDDSNQSVVLERNNAVLPNPLSYQDLSISNGAIYVTFIKLAKGISTLDIGMDGGSISSVEIKYTPLYRSV